MSCNVASLQPAYTRVVWILEDPNLHASNDWHQDLWPWLAYVCTVSLPEGVNTRDEIKAYAKKVGIHIPSKLTRKDDIKVCVWSLNCTYAVTAWLGS